ncbi:MAG: sulfatase-like hydrolase/transferase [Tannerella sp.]|jgi:heptose-I-phosphate ethanolaminephosphotransferase|nr:sulfatase-like hydrolase/transferase [Tannerella sp.]
MKIGTLLKERKLQLFFLIYVLLLVPSVSLIAQNIPVKTMFLGILASFGLLIVIFMLSSFMSTKAIRIFYCVLLAFSLVPSAILLGYLLFAEVMLSNTSMTTLFETNPDESKEFMTHYMNPWVILGIALYILLPIIMIIKMKHLSFQRVGEHKKSFFVCMSLLLLCLAIEPVAQRIYFVDFYRTYADYKIRTKAEEKAIALRQQQNFEVKLLEKNAPKTLVVVIGESLSRHHMSLYGYGRNTNPLLSGKRSSLKIYEDVTSPQVHTIPALRAILSFSDHDHPEYLTECPSIFELFNRGGYETYHISNQPFENTDSSYEPILKQANHIFDLSAGNKPDGVVLNTLQKVLEDDKRKLVVVHLMGNHTVYRFRYPESFDYFNYQKHPVETNLFLSNEARTVIDEYDNSVLYNDYLVASVIELLEKQNESSVMLYFSDHGDEVYDFRDFAGHAYEKVSTYMCEVPFMLWTSGSFERQRRDLVFHTDRPYSTTDVLYGLSDLAGLRYKGYEESRSVFSRHFASRERKIGDLSYETVVERTEAGEGIRPIEYWASTVKDKINLSLLLDNR